jgi:integrase
MTTHPDLGLLCFKEAAERWRESRKPYIKEKSYDMYRQYIRALNEFFGELPLQEIHIGHIREYQAWRGKSAGPSCINHEINTLSQVLKRHGLWNPIKDQYEAMPLPKWIPPRVLTEKEEEHFFIVAASNPEWLVAYLASSITANTTASGCELRGLRLRDVDLSGNPPALYIPSDSVKNEFRARVIPLNERAKLQVERLVMRANKLGATRPDHYLMPFREKRNSYDPTRHTTGWKTAFREVRAAAGLNWLRQHDLRHHAITKLLERPEVSEETVKAIAGHVSKRILEHYSHIRISAKAAALTHITPKPVKSSRGMTISIPHTQSAKAGR